LAYFRLHQQPEIYMSSETVAGTANILHQHSEYEKLQQDYSTQTANELTARNLARHGVDVIPDEVSSWHKINAAAVQAKLDIHAERAQAESSAQDAAINMIASARSYSAAQNSGVEDTPLEEDNENDESNSEDDSELLAIDELYGYDDPEDNAEAALDDVLKAQERE
jgi:hypothetical protein